MSFLNAVINNVEDASLREELQDRVDIILHKIKFMDKVAVSCLGVNNLPNALLDVLIDAAGGEVKANAAEARVVIYHQTQYSMPDLMAEVPVLLDYTWPAVEFNRLYVMDDASAYLSDPESFVASLEDMAEMLYPGYFVFGNEGRTWAGFTV